MDQQLRDLVVEIVDDEPRQDLLLDLLEYEYSKLGKEHRKAREEKIRPRIQDYLRQRGEIM